MVNDGLGVTRNVGELFAELGVDDNVGSALNDRCEGDVGKGDAFRYKVGASREVSLDGFQAANGTLKESSVDGLRVGKETLAELEDKVNVCADL